MTVFNLGSINADHVYQVPHLPGAGETIAASELTIGLGGKGANQSVAVARAGSEVRHIGAVGLDGRWAVERLAALGVDTRHVAEIDAPTGHAIINVDAEAENAIVILAGANRAQDIANLRRALDEAASGDTLMLQNETSLVPEAARLAQERGLRVVYSAAPFEVDAVREVLPYVSTLLLNAIEAEQLSAGLETVLNDLGVNQILITRGAEGAEWRDLQAGTTTLAPAFKVAAVDTTGAGDTFAGYVVAGLDQGLKIDTVLARASAAAAIKVSRPGAADAVPDAAEVADFLKQRRG